MTAKELIAELSKLPPDVEVRYVWDGEVRSDVRHCWLSRNGQSIVLADYDDKVYSEEDRPVFAPTKKEDPYWKTPADPNNPWL